MWDIPGILPGCPGPLEVFKIFEVCAKEGAREGGSTLRKDVFLPSKHLLSAF